MPKKQNFSLIPFSKITFETKDNIDQIKVTNMKSLLDDGKTVINLRSLVL